MKVVLDIRKSAQKNASDYFDKAKKAKKKMEGAEQAIKKSYDRLEKAKKKAAKQEEKEETVVKRKKEWFEKFRWFYSSSGFLCIGGRDATTNEIIVKKHVLPHEIVFHSSMAGSPFFVIKNEEKKEISQNDIEECACATFCYSKGWKMGLASSEVFWVNHDQISKEANAGEYIQKGSFMIRGKMNYVEFDVSFGIGKLKEEMPMAGPLSAVKANCEKHVEIVQGDEKLSKVAKEASKQIDIKDLDSMISVLPVGSKVAKDRRRR